MQASKQYEFGLIGLGVMGRNFILNVADNGFSALGYDLDPGQVEALKEEGGDLEKVNATGSLEEFVHGLATPRKIMLLVPAGPIVDSVIEDLLPLVSEGDLIIDGGNSFFRDTDRREAYLKEKKIHFFGAGVSGGAEGARKGPSLMPGGDREAYGEVRPIFEAVAAQFEGTPCVAYLGPKSAGNYVKMVHNGIEYGLMQLTAEVYDLLRRAGGLGNAEIREVFARWNQGRLQSFLVEITSEILGKKDDLDSGDLIDKILDQGKQKGTGKWTSQNAMDLGIPVPTIDIAVSMRAISAFKADRLRADGLFDRPAGKAPDRETLVRDCEAALYFGFLLTYAQGLHQLAEASETYGYELELATVARIWRAGCIIRAALLEAISMAYEQEPSLVNLVFSQTFRSPLRETVAPARNVVALGVASGIPLPGLSSALSYFDSYTTGRLPMNLVQAQRDFFGSHTYQRTDREGTFHTDWES
ncbi:NADP-dependent phosphogluconate dehydrogenase [Robiginitalea sp. SC105]|uniref:NADP-dependent phosphogluconate dehydrogenase n=1 Tax=Robiginitalea sp. SC105 TaxID=2762332 RepID=UPI00163A4D4F|nr:NADP-dependent phosphogluconate dehydrogenase [Robiginitalea sp. SC105]MBC2839450.1 NADP-dependent phosphogluconate dehydrogenase [Robiginitalea sp. SC105]